MLVWTCKFIGVKNGTHGAGEYPETMGHRERNNRSSQCAPEYTPSPRRYVDPGRGCQQKRGIRTTHLTCLLKLSAGKIRACLSQRRQTFTNVTFQDRRAHAFIWNIFGQDICTLIFTTLCCHAYLHLLLHNFQQLVIFHQIIPRYILLVIDMQSAQELLEPRVSLLIFTCMRHVYASVPLPPLGRPGWVALRCLIPQQE